MVRRKDFLFKEKSSFYIPNIFLIYWFETNWGNFIKRNLLKILGFIIKSSKVKRDETHRTIKEE